MTGYLIDTNVLSEFAQPLPNPQVLGWFRQAIPDDLYASVVTFGEIRLGIENLPPGRRRTDLEAWIETGLPDWFASNLLPVTRDIADEWGKLTIRARRLGMTLTTADGLIAGTARVHDLTLVTRNGKDFAGLGVTILSPWEMRL